LLIGRAAHVLQRFSFWSRTSLFLLGIDRKMDYFEFKMAAQTLKII
jgi:hypothetical protein